ncbi:2,3,4,5-tetrahydropyridine-2,6-dicarboxylate N-acetyltransferase [anaerobic digester metagenome]
MKRLINRVFFHSMRIAIGFITYFDRRIYMRYYNKLLRAEGLKMNGVPRFIAKSVKFDDFDLVTLGDRVVISSNVIFLTHDYSFTTGLIAIDEKPKTDIGILGPIKVGNNVFIGMNSILLPGTSIGDNVIIGAGSVVRGKLPDNVVASGNPATVVTDIQSHTAKLKLKDYTKVIDPK